MSNAIYIATTEAYSGKSVVSLGLMNLLLSKAQKIGYFKPVIESDPQIARDVHIDTIIQYFNLPFTYEDAYAFTRNDVLKYADENKRSEIIDTIIAKYKKLEERCDFTVVEGSDYLGEGAAFEFNINVHIAKNLGIPAIVVESGRNRSTAGIINNVTSAYNAFAERDVKVLMIVVNKVSPDQVSDVEALLSQQLPGDVVLSVMPEDAKLSAPTMQEIAENLKGKVLFGEGQLTNPVSNFIVGAMQLENCLTRLKENTLIVTPGDRGDIMIGALLANISQNYPLVAGIVLTGGLEPEPPIASLIEGSPSVLPIVAVEKGTFEATNVIGSIKSRIYPGNVQKIELVLSTFEKYINVEALEEKMMNFQPSGITPRMFQYKLVHRAKAQKKHIVLPEGNDDRILIAASKLIINEVVTLTILGDPREVEASIKRLNLNFDQSQIRIINPVDAEYYPDYVNTLYELRKSKNITEDMARDMMTDVSYFGTMMVYKGHADGMVSGAVHTTQHTIRPALQFVKTKPGVSTVSSVFFMCLPDRVCVFGDCAVVPNPTAEELAEIAISSAESSINFGIDPKIAMLSYSSGASGQGEDVEKVRRATELVKQRRPDLKIEGPIQYDAAVDEQVGRQKLPDSEVAGQASVLIFPDLNTGNNTYKAVQRETGAVAIGPMLQGLNKPVNDLSRGCTVDDIFNTVVITAIQAQ
ncbi:phosphate acetyltransferase [Danxiaibacter flavus]|uniref:Phosphate acetyltransferase n=1 Tax=Danxiaibacter flavus TaxID=3049108 RepID=A0ABV3ZDV4_9BACT|nr:phosphate acetyltransferase [Chitinophagaceae bacterium DXS]